MLSELLVWLQSGSLCCRSPPQYQASRAFSNGLVDIITFQRWFPKLSSGDNSLGNKRRAWLHEWFGMMDQMLWLNKTREQMLENFHHTSKYHAQLFLDPCKITGIVKKMYRRICWTSPERCWENTKNMHPQKSITTLQAFLGHANYYPICMS